MLAVNGRSIDEAEVVEKVLIDCLRTFRRGIADRKIHPEEASHRALHGAVHGALHGATQCAA